MHFDSACTVICWPSVLVLSQALPPRVFSKYSSAWIRHACLYQWRVIWRPWRRSPPLSLMRLGVSGSGGVFVCVSEDRVGSYFLSLRFLPQKPLQTWRVRKTTRRRALNSASERTWQATIRQTSLNCLKLSITAAMERVQGGTTLHELFKETTNCIKV